MEHRIALGVSLLAFLLLEPAAWSQSCACDPSEQLVVAPNPVVGSFLGHDVAGAGGVLAVGAPRAPGAAGPEQGAVFVYRDGGSSWVLEAQLAAPDGQALDRFGRAVAVHADTLVIGAPLDDGPLSTQGSIHVFERSGGSWVHAAKLEANVPAQGAGLGRSLAFDGTTLLAGAPGENASGVVHVFERAGSTWAARATIAPAGLGALGEFGDDVALDGDVLVAGAPSYNGAAIESGAAWIYERSGSSWNLRVRLDPPTPFLRGHFGAAVGIAGRTIAVGAPEEPGGPTHEGAVYVFERNGSSWSFVQRVVPASGSGAFGASLAVTRHGLLVGAPRDSTGAFRSGAAFLFTRDAGGWVQLERLLGTAPGIKDALGSSVALFGGRAFSGARRDRVDGVNDAGSVRVFAAARVPVAHCSGKQNSLGCTPFVTTRGVASASGSRPFDVVANDVLPVGDGTLLYGFGRTQTSFHGGRLCVRVPLVRWLPVKTPAVTGTGPCPATLRADFQERIRSGVDPALTVGAAVHAQWIQQDPLDPAGYGDSLSDAVRFVICE